MAERDYPLPHSLVPLALAVVLVPAKLAERSVRCGLDPNGLRGGRFCEGGRELRFVDGRPTKYLLAVHARDIGSVVEMLAHPERAARIRSRVLRAHARQSIP